MNFSISSIFSNQQMGNRTIDALRKWCLIKDKQLLETEVVHFENAILSNAQAKSGSGGRIIALLGVPQLLDDIEASTDSNKDGRFARLVCIFIISPKSRLTRSSATHFYASQALPAAGLRIPKVFVTAESVRNGKPAPIPTIWVQS